MFTAKDMHKKLQDVEECVDLDNWLETWLFNQFKELNKPYATIGVTYLFQTKGWTEKGFREAMRQRGFSVVRRYDQRDGDYYEITFPAQEL